LVREFSIFDWRLAIALTNSHGARNGTMNQIERTTRPGGSAVQEKRGPVPAVQKTLRILDCGGTTPLSLHVPLAPDALELGPAFCLCPEDGERANRK